MMHGEFEELAGYRVTYETYTNIIEPMYLAIPETISKMDFIKLLNRKELEYIPEKSPEWLEREKELKAQLEALKEELKWCEERIQGTKRMLENETDATWIKTWKANLKNYKEQVKAYKIEIKNIKFVLS